MSYDARDFAQLPLEHAIGRDTIQRYVSTSIAWTIEVRRCTCGLRIAMAGSDAKKVVTDR